MGYFGRRENVRRHAQVINTTLKLDASSGVHPRHAPIRTIFALLILVLLSANAHFSNKGPRVWPDVIEGTGLMKEPVLALDASQTAHNV